ncbi:unnamed protein product [Camellia sinensis]
MDQALKKPTLAQLVERRTVVVNSISLGRWFESGSDNIGPKIHKVLEKNKTNAVAYIPAFTGDKKFEVRGMHGDQFIVDLKKETCSCTRWELTGIPCAHAISVIWTSMEYVHYCYKKDSFLKAYTHMICPMNGAKMWKQSGKKPMFSLEYLKQPGRPRKARRREPDEGPKGQKPTKLRRFKKNLSCRKCGQKGHNTRTYNITAGERDVGTFASQGPMPRRPPPVAAANFANQGPMLRRPLLATVIFASQPPMPRRPPPAAITFASQLPMPMRPTPPFDATSITQASRQKRVAPAKGGISKKRG